MQTPDSESGRALQVCANCKVRKRKCDKARPRCSHCVNKRLECSYSETQRSSTQLSNDHPWYASVPDAKYARADSIDHPTMWFLDPTLLRNGGFDANPATVSIPPRIADLIGDTDELRTTADKYFAHIHPWMPFISKKRLYDIYLHLPLPTHPDLALLFLAQKLITTLPPASPENIRTPLYHATKHFHLELESNSALSVHTLQANILIALYEVGHAIYPAAYLTIGSCARYAYALGISVKGINPKRPTTMIEVEERRRIWWAITILDRFVTIGCPGRPFATPEPTLDDLLPSDDAAWDQGTVTSNNPATVSSPLTSHMSKFALLCQAARLLGQVLTYVATEPDSDSDVGVQLDRTLHSMLTVALNVDEPDYDQITFIFSAIVALYTPTFHLTWTSPVPPERLARALSACKLVTEREDLPNFMRSICPLTERSPRDMSPWGCFFAYQVCGVSLRAEQRSETKEALIAFLKEAFVTLNGGWRVAGVYLRLLEAQEAMRCV